MVAQPTPPTPPQLADKPPPSERPPTLDAADPLAAFRDRFVIADPEVVYLDGNSLGRLPAGDRRSAATASPRSGAASWSGAGTTGSTSRGRVGDLIARLLGARPGEVIVSDSTTVNFYKLAACRARGATGSARSS